MLMLPVFLLVVVVVVVLGFVVRVVFCVEFFAGCCGVFKKVAGGVGGCAFCF